MNITPELLIQTFLTGIPNGALIAIIALGYTLVYGIIELINFAHGDVFTLGTFMALTVVTSAGLSVRTEEPTKTLLLIVTLLAAMVFAAVVNVLIERLAYRRLRRAPRLAPLISAIGVSFILANIGLHWKGAAPVNFPNLLPNVNILQAWFGVDTGLRFRVKDLFVVAVAVPLMIGLDLFVRNTKLGKAMRATAQDRDTAQLMGININYTIAATFFIGGALAGAAGFIQGLYNNSARFDMGFTFGLLAFTAAVLGGIGNMRGTMAGGMLLGIIAAYSDILLDSKWTPAVVFGILVIIMVFRPSGLFGQEVPEKV